ncbi:hypothetical protein CTAM01_00818, partial [Colletotrichum tamarilloi]
LLVLHPPPKTPSSATPGRPDCPLSSSTERPNPPVSELLRGGGGAGPWPVPFSQPKPTYLVERRYQSPYLLPVRYLSPRRYTCPPSTASRYLAPYASMYLVLLPLRLSAPLALSLWVLESALALLRPLGAPWTLPHALELCHVRTATAVPHQHRPKCGYRSTPVRYLYPQPSILNPHLHLALAPAGVGVDMGQRAIAKEARTVSQNFFYTSTASSTLFFHLLTSPQPA